MSKTLVSLAFLTAFGASAFAVPAASTSAPQVANTTRCEAAGIDGASLAMPCRMELTTVAKHGADDGKGHDRRDDKGGRGKAMTLAKHGADDGKGHDRHDDKGGRGKPMTLAKHGADDGKGHDRHDDKGGRGKATSLA